MSVLLSIRAMFVWACMALCICVRPSLAAPSDEQAAHTLVRDGRYQAALDAFERLYAKQSAPRYLLNIAVIHHLYMPGRCPDALRSLDRFFVVCSDCALKAEAERLRERTRRACIGQITLTTAPPGAEVRVDDEPVGVAPVVVDLVEGGHLVSATLDGHHPIERSFVVRGGEPDRVEIVLRPLADPVEQLFERGRDLADRDRHTAALEAFTDGEALEPSPRFALAAARSSLALGDCQRTTAALDRFDDRCPDCTLRTQSVQVRLARDATCAPPPPPARGGLSPWVWAGVGVGAAGVAGGAIFHGRYSDAVDARDAAQADGEGIDTLRGLHDDAVLDYQLMQVGYIAGGVGLVGAALAWWLDDDSDPSPAVRPGPQGAAVRLDF